MTRPFTYFAADVHLGLQVGDPAERERRFVAFLRSIPAGETQALYLLGDIWDFWYEYRDVVPKGYVAVFAALQDLMAAGVKVYYFQGNHDIWTYSYFRELGMIQLEQPAVVTLGTRRFCLGHGDGLGPVPLDYRLLRAMFHARFFQKLFSLLHPDLAFRLAKHWSKSSRLGRSGSYVFKGEDEPLYRFCADFREPVDYFLFGHYHCRVDMPVRGLGRLVILPDWMGASHWAVYDSQAKELKLI